MPIPSTRTDTVTLPVVHARVLCAVTSGESDVTSDQDTKKSFIFEGETRVLNESGASDGEDTEIEWDNERGIVDMRKYGTPRNGVDDAVVESERIWLVTAVVQSSQPLITLPA